MKGYCSLFWALLMVNSALLLAACDKQSPEPTPIVERTDPTEPAAQSVTPTATLAATAAHTAIPQPAATPTVALPQRPFIKDGRLYLGDRLLLDPEKDAQGCFQVGAISESPTGAHFLAVMDCFEGDNQLFLFTADGDSKQLITAKWDFLLYQEVTWDTSGESFVYRRVNSCCSTPPDGERVPFPGQVSVDVSSGQKTVVASFRVSGVEDWDYLYIRPGPGEVDVEGGRIPSDGQGIEITGEGQMVGDWLWVPIVYQDSAGWVNSRYLAEEGDR